MSQMVLPQNLSNNQAPEAKNSPASASTATEKSGDSRFDQVSRSEQQRLEAKRAEKTERAEKAERAEAARDKKVDGGKERSAKAETGSREETSKPRDKDKEVDSESRTEKNAPAAKESTSKDEGQSVAVSEDGARQSQALDSESVLFKLGETTEKTASETVDVESVPVTFAGLQSLVSLNQGSGASSSGTALPGAGQNASVMQGSTLQGAMMANMTMNGNGKSGALPGQSPGQKTSTTGVALAESLLAGVGGDTASKASENSILQNAIRFQGALESLTNQPNSVNAPRMSPEAAVMRGYATSIDVPVSHAEWGDKMAGKLTFLTARNMSVAEIHLTPPDMGPMEVRVQVQQDQANITVHSANPVVRDQLELHSHRLRDMLNEQGFSLEKFDVSDSGSQQAGQGESGGGGDTGEGLMADSDTDEAGAEPQSLDLTWNGQVDTFA
ncbi:flagellar hook-length control protein FliK [Marinobacter sp. CHS3-4]|uniref:flagellar hook-length control protein FliK n=1 Tax=Marinobacter sp. CHS3-4 TaxID=3045174 RepID=UPI0024B4988A|nr:flagellar hook-length control protein FliK [Marinobacter sp. CHS3-4]MDI9245908.1 flagellar hook-length control protein FliK [Marinobacter sp. CHS3-4]